MTVARIFEILVYLSFVPALTYLIVSIFVLHNHETEENRLPWMIQFWPFLSDMKTRYPDTCKFARWLFWISFGMAAPWIGLSIVQAMF